MAFALQLKDSLQLRESQVPGELATGDTLGAVLTRDLLAVEAAADTDMLTSILLLDGSTLRHGAAPHLPPAYCSAVDGSEIGPRQGSCGTAAFFGRPVYVTDIDTDPLWADYRELALAHGLRACWSTPIFDDEAAVIGTFAIYHLTPRAPTPDEVKAIQAITAHVARAIMLSAGRDSGDQGSPKPVLKLVTDDKAPDAGAQARRDLLVEIAGRFEAIARALDIGIEALAAGEPDSLFMKRLRRARKVTQEGADLAQSILDATKNES